MSWSAPLRLTGLSRSEIIWIAIAIAVGLAGVVARIHNAWWFYALLEFDGSGHALQTLAWYEGRLPDPRAWSGFHPPLFYLLGAGLWHLLPEVVPVHVGLRWLSASFGALAIWLIWRSLRQSFALVDATLIAVLAWCIPFVVVATSTLGNETLCTLIVTLLMIRMMRLPERDADLPRHALGSGLLAGIGLLTKSSSLVALAAVGLTYLIRLRASPARALQVGAITAGVALVVAAPHYARIMAFAGGSPLSAFSAAAVSPEVMEVMEAQPPGVRSLADYVSLPAATLLHPSYDAPGMTSSIPGLLYASAWADAHGGFLSLGVDPRLLRAQVAMSIAGLLPTALLLLGSLRVARRMSAYTAWLCPLLLLAGLSIAFLGYSWRYPSYAAIKASYLLPALLPLTLLTAEGLCAAAPPLRPLLRGALLAIAAGFTALMWWGWWY